MENMRKPKNGKHAENILDKSPKAKKDTFQNFDWTKHDRRVCHSLNKLFFPTIQEYPRISSRAKN
jgi:hypothetical protein